MSLTHPRYAQPGGADGVVELTSEEAAGTETDESEAEVVMVERTEAGLDEA